MTRPNSTQFTTGLEAGPGYGARVSHRLPVLLAAIGATALLLGSGVWLRGSPEPAAPPAAEPTGLGDYDTTAVALARGPFCDRLTSDSVADAIGGEPADSATWGDGDRLPGVGVIHEYGCRYAAADGREARAWVLAAPVTPDRARELVQLTSRESDCRRRRGAPAYGAPSVALECTGPQRTVTSHRGLFGDAWLTCTLALTNGVPERERWERTEDWCVAVAEAARR